MTSMPSDGALRGFAQWPLPCSRTDTLCGGRAKASPDLGSNWMSAFLGRGHGWGAVATWASGNASRTPLSVAGMRPSKTGADNRDFDINCKS
jgi:hypothetical protein